ncbi:peptidase S41 [Carboxylicivirga sp. A043]|uniref:S41 family peptidase n=1 Tax=Carboxylicivirga litoralis TaxID=2816963 RepID=UPI0021CB43C2|nr:S41 family peptidase [Carboxylicivirga sp. A043]MCU4156556.1 peptidase S41 [Carboxylicivirga sp. A043]
MKDIKFIYLSLLLGFLSFMTACDDDKPEPIEPNPVPEEVQAINQFVWENMDFAYFWNSEMPEIDYKQEEDTYDFFDKLLYSDVDHWSFITDDIEALNNYFSGISKSMGHSFRLFRLTGDSEDIIGFIEYVEPGSPADLAGGIYRGRLFHKIDGKQLTISNYSELLNQDEYTMTFGVLNQDLSITDETPSVKLIAVEWQSNPILLSKVIEHGGAKVGYLVYNSFVSDYDDELEAVFADFKSQGVDNLVLDLRYNSGGSVNTAILLSSLIAPADKAGDVLLRTSYNTNLTNYFDTQYPNETDLYVDRLVSNANNLDLNKVAVLTTFKTASASEMVIYGLDPHMEVYHIGEQTHGKYYGSITISDPDEKHTWAIQPIVMRAENKTNSINYNEGLIPDQDRVDFLDAADFYELGDVKEDFLAAALTELTGVVPANAQLKGIKRKVGEPVNVESKLSHPLQYDMHYTLKE